jgi:hypothetical protein
MNKSISQLESEIFYIKIYVNSNHLSQREYNNLIIQRKNLKEELCRLKKVEYYKNKILKIKEKISIIE